MLDDFSVLSTIAPDMVEVLYERFQILRHIHWMEPVGRRSLAVKLNVTERVLRTETDFLKQLQLIETSKSGMTLTEKGLEVYYALRKTMERLLGTHQMEKQLAEYFKVARCIVVAGDSDQEQRILNYFGQEVTEALLALLPDAQNTIAVMGGTTMAAVADNLENLESAKRHNVFVPARGGIGEAVDIQANSICAKMAQKSGGAYRALYVPERVSKETYKPLLQEPTVREVLSLISNATCVIHGIGKAMYMAERRGMGTEELRILKERKAVAESFGYFFDETGEIVYTIPRIGLQWQDLQEVPCILAVAGGKSKAKAIHSYMKNAPSQTWLITDEGAAKEVLKGVTL